MEDGDKGTPLNYGRDGKRSWRQHAIGIAIFVGIAPVAVLLMSAIINGADASKMAGAAISLVFIAALCVGTFVLLKKSVAAGVREAQGKPPRVLQDGPGKYRIIGVDRSSKMDTVWYCQAESSDNAKAKGELENILVTRVERVD